MIDLITMLMLVMGLVIVGISWLKRDLKCPPPKIIYKYIPKHTLDVQFGEENKPTQIYEDMFTKSTPWIGGYDLGGGKTFISISDTATRASR